MAANDKEQLKRRVIEYLHNKPSYDPNENLILVCDQGYVYFILYGEDLQVVLLGLVKQQRKHSKILSVTGISIERTLALEFLLTRLLNKVSA